MKSRCCTRVHELEFVKMIAGGLDYSIRKKLDTQYLRYMTQLAHMVRQVEHLKVEKARLNRHPRKENIAYI